jgi:hypothetical protein
MPGQQTLPDLNSHPRDRQNEAPSALPSASEHDDSFPFDAVTARARMQTADAIKEMFSNDWQNIAGQYQDQEPGLLPKRTNSLLESLCSQLRGHVERNDVFKPNGRVIHFLNGMLHINANSAELMPFSPDYYSRNFAHLNGIPMRNAPASSTFWSSQPCQTTMSTFFREYSVPTCCAVTLHSVSFYSPEPQAAAKAPWLPYSNPLSGSTM